MSSSQKKQDCIECLVTYGFLQVRSEAGLSSREDLPSCAYLETHDSFWRTSEIIRCEQYSWDLGCIVQSPAGALAPRDKKFVEQLLQYMTSSLRQGLKIGGMQEKNPKDQGC